MTQVSQYLFFREDEEKTTYRSIMFLF